MAAVSADGSTVRVLILLEFFVQPLDCIGGAHAAPLARRQAREGKQAFSCFLQAVSNGAMLEPPFAVKALRRAPIASGVIA
jgi:hypothetical protein